MRRSMVRKYEFSLAPLLIATFGMAALHCSSSRTGFGTSEEVVDASPIGNFTPTDAGENADVDSSVARGSEQECGDGLQMIYVVTQYPHQILRFDPLTATFSLLGNVSCPNQGNPTSMAIDRHGVAWLRWDSGFVQVRLDTLECSQLVLPDANLNSRQGMLGMGFTADTTTDAGESLYFCANQIIRLDPATLRTTFLGETPEGQPLCELTGTGDGRLYGYMYTNGNIAQIDTTTGAEILHYRTSAINTGSFAVAQWGGDFYIFSQYGDYVKTRIVTRYSPATDESTVIVPDSPYDVIGAGVSTCAPYKPIK